MDIDNIEYVKEDEIQNSNSKKVDKNANEIEEKR